MSFPTPEEGGPIRIVLMGQGGVGKTAMVIRYRFNDFVEGYMPTIGDMYTTDEESPYGPRHVEIDDTAGQVRTRAGWVEFLELNGWLGPFLCMHAFSSFPGVFKGHAV